MTGKDKLRYVLKNIKEKSPIMIVSGAVTDFKELYRGPIRSVHTVEEVRELVSYYHEVKELGYPLVIEDLGFLSQGAMEGLLKFVEETPLKIILLSTFDTATSVLMSRIRGYVKYTKEKTDCEFMKVGPAKERINKELKEDSSQYDRMERVLKYCPLITYYDKKIVCPNKDRIINILGV